jgi:phosphate transport system substrate-binding protein
MVSAEWTNSNRNQFPNVIPLQICIDGVALIVNNRNTVTNLTAQQVLEIYRAESLGRTTNWSAVGGNNTPINAISRESGSGTRDCFQSIIGALSGGLGSGYDLHSTASVLTSTGAVVNAVANNPNSIGYVSLANVDNTVKAIRYGGVEATRANLQNGSYTLQRPFLLCVNNSRTLNEAEKQFLLFIFSAQGQAIIDGRGLVGMSDSGIRTELGKVGLTPS